MIRYDQVEKKEVEEEVEESSSIKHVKIDEVMMKKIADIFLEQLRILKINDVLLVENINKSTIKMNPDITLEMLGNALKKPLNSKEEFIKEYYMYRLDSIINEAYGEKVTAIQEYPYSFQALENPEIIQFEFIS